MRRGAVAFEMEFEHCLFRFLVVAERSGRGRVLAATLPALETLITSARETGFDLARSELAMGASNQVERYIIVCFDLDSPPISLGRSTVRPVAAYR